MAYSNNQLHGAVLEEAILYLLQYSGYNIVVGKGRDPSLNDGKSGLEVLGRGAWHQIDSVADFKLTPPFSNPQRLLIEAKYYSDKVGLPIIRNAAGVLKDVSEGWVVNLVSPKRRKIVKKRFHYLYALFSTSDFTVPAQDYAYAQDIYLLPLRKSTYFRPVINAIDNISIDNIEEPPQIKTIRNYVRNQLLRMWHAHIEENIPGELLATLDTFIESCRHQSFGFIAMFGGQFPAFLVAEPTLRPETLPNIQYVRIRWIEGSWFIEDQVGNRLFSFDLPEEIFERYARPNSLNREIVANIKDNLMREFFAYHYNGEQVRLIQFKLDTNWFDSVRRNIRERNSS